MGIKKRMEFEMEVKKGRGLVEGELRCIDEESGRVDGKYRVTSGSVGYQDELSVMLPGRGPIPPEEMCGIGSYTVRVKPIYMPRVKGVEGNFYKIDPHLVKVKGKVTRGDFGVHYDANVPGSAGCIVLRSREEWKGFERLMKDYERAGIEKVKLYIKYN